CSVTSFFLLFFFFFSSRRRHTRFSRDWSSDVCSSDLGRPLRPATRRRLGEPLPHQQADRPRAHPAPPELSITKDAQGNQYPVLRSEERRVGKECESRWGGYE